MIKTLLTMTGAYAVLGGAVALGYFGIAIWLCLMMAVGLPLAYAGIRRPVAQLLQRRFATARAKLRASRSAGRRFIDDHDYLDWTNRRGRWAQDGNR